MTTAIEIGPYHQAQGRLVATDGARATIDLGGCTVTGRLVSPAAAVTASANATRTPPAEA